MLDFSLAYIKSEHKFLFKNFSSENIENTKAQLLDLESINDCPMQAIIIDAGVRNNPDLMAQLEKIQRFLPIRGTEEFNTGAKPLDQDQFDLLPYDSGRKMFERMYQPWVVQNNLVLLHELFKTLQHLLELWPNDRTAFFEELWFLLKNNMGAKDLTLIYNDIEREPVGKESAREKRESKAESKDEHAVERSPERERVKERLIQVKIEGSKLPTPVQGGEFESKLMDRFGNPNQEHFEIIEYNPEKGHIVATAAIRKSPIVIMGHTYQLTSLQKVLLTTLFEGLQLNHNVHLQ